MSLLDALLNEGYRDPRDIYIALRADGQRGSGSGSVDDPYNGSVAPTAPIAVTLGLVVGANAREIVVTTASPHGYIEGDIVLLSGTRDLSGAPASDFDGSYYVAATGLSASQFKCYRDSPATSSFTGVASVARRVFLIDELLRRLTRPVRQANLVIHLGPGLFETRGTAGAVDGSATLGTQGWEVGPGWKIRGAGIDVTTIKLADARGAPDFTLYFVIGAQTWYLTADYAEASDLTLDCNAQGNQKTSVAAIYLAGSHTRVRRVRAINWGPQAGPESFVISVGGSHPFLPEITDCVIEDCIADQPGLNNTHETTILGIVGSPFVAADARPGYFRGGAIRRNYVDATYTRNEVPIERIELNGAVATVTTKIPHGRKENENDWVVIAGAIVNGTEHNTFNGSYQIGNTTATTFEYTPYPTTPGSNPTGTMFVDRFPSHWVAVKANGIVSTEDPSHPNQYRLTTLTPHNRIPGNNVVISGVYVIDPDVGLANAFNDSHLVEDVPKPTELIFTAHPTPTRPVGTIQYGPYYPHIGVVFHVGAGGGTCQVVEHNRVIGTAVGVYGDSFSTKSLHVRNNRFNAWSWCIYRNWQNYFSPPGSISNVHGIEGSCLTYGLEGGQPVATFTTIEPHGLGVGAEVTIGGASVVFGSNNPYSSDFVGDPAQPDNWNPDNPYNSTAGNPTFTILAVPSPNQFKFVLPHPPGLGNSNANSNPDLVPSNAGGSPVFSLAETSNVVTAESLVPAPTAESPNRVKFTTPSNQPHNFQLGDIISVFGVKMIGSPSGTFFNPYNGVFQVSDVDSGNIFYYETLTAALNGALTTPPPQCAKQVGTALTRNGTIARFQTVSPHFLTVGQIVWIDRALVKGNEPNPFNGKNFAITSAGVTSFTYEMSSAPATHAYGGAGYQGKDYERLLHFENNIIELLTDAPILPAYGVQMGGGADFRPNYIFRQVAIRGNHIRHMDNAEDSSSGYSGAVAGYNCGALLIDNNVIALDHASPIQFGFSGMVNCLNNRTPQGALIKAKDVATAQLVDSYFPAAEEAFVLAML